MCKKLIPLLLSLFVGPALLAQQSYDSSFHFYYYDQKLSMFEQMPNKSNAVVFLGDSITDGGEWAELFPKLNVLNRGISADNTFGILFRLSEVTKRKPKIIFLLIGINDIARGIPDSVIIGNYAKIIARIKEESPKTKVFVQSLLPTNSEFTNFPKHQNKLENVHTVNAALMEMAVSKNCYFLNLYPSFVNGEGKLSKTFTNDGLHLLGTGYALWKKILIEKNCFK